MKRINKNINIYTDLALEEREKFSRNVEIDGVAISKEYKEKIKMTITKVDILNNKGAKAMGKPEGTYITMETKYIKEYREKLSLEVVKEIINQLNSVTEKIKWKKIFIVGLGNIEATPDALGPKTVESIEIAENVFTIAPGVLAQTGMETYSIIRGITKEIKPDMILVIDSLAARNVRRITTTIQLANTGIVPGSGIGNARPGLNEKTLGVPVIAIGVPMVVSSATIVNDTMEKLLSILTTVKKNKGELSILDNYTSEEKYQLFEELISEDTEQLYVTPKDIDEIVNNLSYLISKSINQFIMKK